MAYLVNNNGLSTLAAAITTTTQTSVTLAAGHGARFPSPTGGDYTFITVENAANAVEIICIVGRSADVLTVGVAGSASADSAGRGQEGTTALSTWLAGDIVEGRATAAVVARGGNAKTAAELAAVGGAALVGNTAAGNIVATTVQAALNELDAKKAKLAGDTAQAFSAAAIAGTTGTFSGALSAPSLAGLTTPLSVAQGGTGGTSALFAWPVGAVYTSVISTSPATLFGGTWASFGAGRVLVGLDATQTEFDVIEETGGAKTHTLSAAEMPSHSHAITITDPGHTHATTQYQSTGGGLSSASAVATGSVATPTASSTTGITASSATAGSGAAHNNLQPYIVVYFWKRTA